MNLNRTDVVIYWVLALFTGALAVHAYGVITGRYEYTLPSDLVEFTRLGLVAALGAQTYLAVKNKIKKD